MYPYRLFLDVTLYDILVAIGVAAAFAVFLLYADKLKISSRLQILALVSAILGVALGFVSADLYRVFTSGSRTARSSGGA